MTPDRRLAAATLVAVVLGTSALPGHAQEAPYTAADVRQAVEDAAAETGVSAAYLGAIVYCESRNNPYAVGRLGERGPVQILPGGSEWPRFFDVYGFNDPEAPAQAVRFLSYELGAGRGSAWSCA